MGNNWAIPRGLGVEFSSAIVRVREAGSTRNEIDFPPSWGIREALSGPVPLHLDSR